ncbi:MAG: hypothetical protein ACJATA_002056 [Sphingobacteriales bacterium]|jgi:hypothetical protein
MKKHVLKNLLLGAMLYLPAITFGQADSTTQGAIMNRPLNKMTSGLAIGGYVEGNSNYLVEDGLTDGFSLELRRFNLFIQSEVGNRISFLSELEFEHGTEEIALETALLDFTIDPMLVFRGGIILPPIGQFNVRHDSPLWNIVDRPDVSTKIIPSTLSEVGFGFHGKRFITRNRFFTYDVYLVNGLNDGIYLTNDNLDLSAGKGGTLFEENHNGNPMYTGRVAVGERKFGEFGLSYYGGVYNTHRLDGLKLADKRRLDLVAFDYSYSQNKLMINAEGAWLTVDAGPNPGNFLATQQFGFFLDFGYKLFIGSFLGFENSEIGGHLRSEYVDLHTSTIVGGGEAGNEILAFTPSLTWRPNQNAVLKINYRYSESTDLLNNPAARAGLFQIGIASYF